MLNSSTTSSARRQKQRKVLLMGKSGAGKSSMRSIVFSNYVAKDVRRLGATIDVEHSNIRFMGNLMLNLWDCGGQDGFTESYLTHQRSHVFSSVAVLIFVFDVESREFSADLINYASIVTALRENSPQAKIFVLVHKMDLIMLNMRDVVFNERSDAIRAVSIEHGFGAGGAGADGIAEPGKEVDFWGTSIWDQSLYKAWTQVIYHLVPNANAIESLLRQLADVIEAHELILYERTTCLMVTHITAVAEAANPHPDRFERLSSILKSHKHSIAKHTGMPAGSANFAELQIKTGEFMFLITRLTENTNLAVCLPSGEAMYNAARINIALSRHKFEELDLAAKPRGGENGGRGTDVRGDVGRGEGDDGRGDGNGGSQTTAFAYG